jgi:lipocalin
LALLRLERLPRETELHLVLARQLEQEQQQLERAVQVAAAVGFVAAAVVVAEGFGLGP